MLLSLEFLLAKYGITLREEDGQGLVEYVLIIALIAIMVIGGFAAVSGALNGKFTAITSAINTAPGGGS